LQGPGASPGVSQRGRGGPVHDPRNGRPLGPNQQPMQQQQLPQGHQQQQPMMQQQQAAPQQGRPLKGIPQVVPDFAIPGATKESPTQHQATSNFSQGPNLMQKLGDLTAGVTGGEGGVDNIISRGKELIFMKFGLGGK